MKLRIGISDDNKTFLTYLNELIRTYFNNAEGIVIDALAPEELCMKINNGSFLYDIIVTDIDMGDLNGIDLAKEINHINSRCFIIFVSNYLNYATEVYDVEHIYFVLKSDVEVRLPKALEKAYIAYNKQMSNFLMIHYHNVEYKLSQNDIIYIEALGRYLYIHDTEQTIKCINSLKEISTDLSDSFKQCHKSYIINMSYIRSISRTNCILTSGADIPISQTYYKSFQNAYVKFVSQKFI